MLEEHKEDWSLVTQWKGHRMRLEMSRSLYHMGHAAMTLGFYFKADGESLEHLKHKDRII